MNLKARLRSMLERFSQPWVLGPGVALIILLASAAGFLKVLELKWLDQQLRLRGPIAHRRDVVVVSLGEDTFRELNRPWPFPREVIARAIEKIEAAKPRAIGLDLLYIEPSVFGPEDDAALGATLRKYPNVVLAALFEEGKDDPVYVGSEMVRGQTLQALKLPVPALRDAPFGFVNLLHDADGFVRRAPLWRDFRGRERMETLARQVFNVATREGVRARPPAGQEIFVNFRGPARTFETVPFHQVLRGEIEPFILAGKIVFVGATSPVLHDVFNTPFAPQDPMPGVEIQANVVDNLLRGDPLRAVGVLPALVLVVLAALLATFVAVRFPPLRAFAIVAGVGLGYALVCYGALAWFRVWIEEVRVQLALFGAYGAVVVRNYVQEERAKRRLSRFFSPAVVQDILKHQNMLLSQRRKITVLFSDIRNFTTIAEKLEPEMVVKALRLYFNTMTPIVFRNGGSVDKFVGDAIMAFFNAPTEDPQHADHAVKTGVEMIRALEGLSPLWEKLTGHSLHIGVGINTGEPVIGTMGSDDRLEYSCIGDAVNLAARLETLTKEVKADIVISEHTYRELTGRFAIRPIKEVQVKGREQAVQVYAVDARLGADEAELKMLVDATLQTLTTTPSPSLTELG
jgi:adenylate cyclase